MSMDSLDSRARPTADEQGWAPADFKLTMAFQPIVDMAEGTIFAHEALVRGPNGESAAHVLSGVPADSQSRFDQLCRRRAMELAARLNISERISINFQPLPENNLERGIIRTVKLADTFDLPLSQLLFEITDSHRTTSLDFVKEVIGAYQANGLATALDNFGNGLVELNDLEMVAPDIIKLDRELTHNIDSNRVRQIFVKSVVDVCNEIDCRVIAQGVESQAELESLLSFGITHFQGYLLARPSLESVAELDNDLPAGP